MSLRDLNRLGRVLNPNAPSVAGGPPWLVAGSAHSAGFKGPQLRPCMTTRPHSWTPDAQERRGSLENDGHASLSRQGLGALPADRLTAHPAHTPRMRSSCVRSIKGHGRRAGAITPWMTRVRGCAIPIFSRVFDVKPLRCEPLKYDNPQKLFKINFGGLRTRDPHHPREATCGGGAYSA